MYVPLPRAAHYVRCVVHFILFMRIGGYVFHLCTRSRTVEIVEKALLIPHTYIVNFVCINIDILCTQYNFKLYLNVGTYMLYCCTSTAVHVYDIIIFIT